MVIQWAYFYLSEPRSEPPTYERIFYSRSVPDRDVYDIESDHGLDGEPLAPENTVLTLEQNDNGMYCIMFKLFFFISCMPFVAC